MKMAAKTEEMISLTREEYEELLSAKAESQRLSKQVETLSKELDWLLAQLRLGRKHKFGSKADTVSDETYEQLSLLFDEAEATRWAESVQAKDEVPVAAHSRSRKTGALSDIVPEDIPVEVEEHRLSGEELLCKTCGSKMVEIGKTVKRTLKIKPAEILIHEDWYYTYACKECEKATGFTPIEKAPRDCSVLPGSYASPEAIAYIMTQKYDMGVPLYRMERDLKRRKILLSRQTMANWVISGSRKWLQPIYEELHKRLVQEEIIHADETTLQVLHEPGKKADSESYIWLYRTGKFAKHPIVLYEYQPNRRQVNPAEFLKGFSGYLQTDGYGGYNGVDNVVHVGCLAHLRRKFTDAEKSAPKGAKSPTTTTALAYCSRLFDLEKKLADSSCAERYALRQEQAKPILEEFYTWAKTRTASPKSKLGVALTYLKNQMPKIQNYLLDGRLEATNNPAERSIKPFVIDRKNFLFANTPAGATASAVTFSIIQTAKESGLDPFRYLTYIFQNAPVLAQTESDWATILLPENAPASCRA